MQSTMTPVENLAFAAFVGLALVLLASAKRLDDRERRTGPKTPGNGEPAPESRAGGPRESGFPLRDRVSHPSIPPQ